MGQPSIACIFEGSIAIPSGETLTLRYSTVVVWKSHFSGHTCRLALCNLHRTSWMCSWCLSQSWRFPRVWTGNTISGPKIPKARPIPISAWGYLPLARGRHTSLSRDNSPVAIPDPCPGLPIRREQTFIVTHQEQATSSFTYNLLSTIYIVAWMHCHQRVRLLDHDPDPGFHSDVP